MSRSLLLSTLLFIAFPIFSYGSVQKMALRLQWLGSQNCSSDMNFEFSLNSEELPFSTYRETFDFQGRKYFFRISYRPETKSTSIQIASPDKNHEGSFIYIINSYLRPIDLTNSFEYKSTGFDFGAPAEQACGLSANLRSI